MTDRRYVREAGPAGERPIVYVRPVAVADLPDEIRTTLDGRQMSYAVHDADGARLALVGNRQMAFDLARVHRMTPVHAH